MKARFLSCRLQLSFSTLFHHELFLLAGGILVAEQILAAWFGQQLIAEKALNRNDQRPVAVDAPLALHFLEIEIAVRPLGDGHALRRLDFIGVEVLAPNVARLVDRQCFPRPFLIGSERKRALFPLPIFETCVIDC